MRLPEHQGGRNRGNILALGKEYSPKKIIGTTKQNLTSWFSLTRCDVLSIQRKKIIINYTSAISIMATYAQQTMNSEL